MSNLLIRQPTKSVSFMNIHYSQCCMGITIKRKENTNKHYTETFKDFTLLDYHDITYATSANDNHTPSDGLIGGKFEFKEVKEAKLLPVTR